MQLGRAEGAARPVRAPADRLADRRRPRPARREIVVVDGPGARRSTASFPTACRRAVQQEANGHRRRRARRRRAPRTGARSSCSPGDVPLITGRGDRGPRRRPRRASGAAATILDVELDDPDRLRARRARAPTARVERVVETKAAGRRDARASSPSARSTPASTPSTARRSPTRSHGLTTDNAQGELYLPDVLPIAARRRPPGRRPRRRRPRRCSLGVNDRVRPRRSVARARAGAHPRRSHARRRDDRRPGGDVDRRRRHDRRRHRRSSPAACAARRASAPAARVGPLTTLIDATLADENYDPHAYVDEAEIDDGVTVGPFAYLRPGTLCARAPRPARSSRSRTPTSARGTQGPAPVLHRRRRRRRGHQPRRRHDHRQLRRRRQAPHDDRRPGAAPASTPRSSRRSRSATASSPARVSDHRDVPPGALGIARERQRNIEGYAGRKRRGET